MKRYDRNLLSVLDALLRHGSVSAAAKQLGIGQPATSAALGRLRALFDDDLLIRTARGMTPTARATEIAGPLRALLDQLDGLIEPAAPFDAATSQRIFRLAGGDYVGMTVLPALAKRLSSEAPHVALRFRYVEKDSVPRCIEAGEIDLALMVTHELPNRFATAPLLEDGFVCALRSGHPALKDPLTLDAFVGLPHLLVTERGDERGAVDLALAELGKERHVSITVPSAALVADLLRATDLVATVPKRAGERIAADGSISLVEPPLPTARWTMSMVWSSANTREPGLLWLREALTAVAERC